MNAPIEKYFRMGVVQWMLHPQPRYPLEDSLAALAKDDFFEIVELPPIDGADARAAARRLFETAHMGVCAGMHPVILGGVNPNALDEEERARAERTLIELTNQAHELGAQGVCILSGRWTEETKEACLEQLLKTVTALCRHARQYGMMVEMEVFDYDVDKRALIGPAPLAAAFAAQVRSQCPNFGLVVDLSHLPITHETPEFAVRAMRPYITHFHIGNAVMTPGCPAYGDKHPRFGFPNSVNGVVELTDFFRVLRDEGFFRAEAPYIMSIEIKPQEDEDADVVLANTKRVIRRAWAMLED